MLSLINTKIWLYQKPVDFRKQMDGLTRIISEKLDQNPTEGGLYIFRNRSSDKIKLLAWDKNGFWLCYKRLEKGRFKFGTIKRGAINITKEQLNWLLTGLNYENHACLPEIKACYFH